MQLFRRKVSADNLALELLAFLTSAGDSTTDLVGQAEELEVDLTVFSQAVTHLRAFAIDFSTSMALRDRREKDVVLDAYHDHLKRVAVGSKSGEQLILELGSRIESYTIAAKTPHHLGPTWNVGKVFSDSCGSGMDVLCIGYGSAAFVADCETVKQLCTSRRIVG